MTRDRFRLALLLTALGAAVGFPARAEFPPITPEERDLAQVPGAPTASALADSLRLREPTRPRSSAMKRSETWS